jgi:HEPN domain-containing protein
VNQAELRQMALMRIRDARVLLNGGRWEFAYYVSGYTVECALRDLYTAITHKPDGVLPWLRNYW